MMNVNRRILEQAGNYLGLEEYPGAKDNGTIVGFSHDIGHDWVNDDETPWCASFVGAVLSSLGLPHTGKLNARSYMAWGREVPLQDAKPGDICVFWRGSPDGWQGHVAFFVAMNGLTVTVRGGNQGNKVSDAPYPLERLLSVRRLDLTDSKTNRPTLRVGNTSPLTAVRDLQRDLGERGFFSGKVDGLFGPRTKAAVLAFQSHAGLTTDGIVGPQTWAALEDASPAPVRAVSEDALRAEGSRIIAAADSAEAEASKAKTFTVSTAGVGAGAYLIENMDDVGGKLASAEGVADRLQTFVLTYWPLVVIGVLLYLALNHQAVIEKAQRAIRQFRTDDAQSGKHLGR